MVLHHHEAYDGSGYPSGLAGERIPLGARIFAVGDTFDAMTSNRRYRKALPADVALAEIRHCRGRQFDPHIVDALLSTPVEEILQSGQRAASAEKSRPEILFGRTLERLAS